MKFPSEYVCGLMPSIRSPYYPCESMPKVVNHDEERHKLVLTTIQYITDQGLYGFSLRNLATAHGVTKGHVQHYFDTKDALLLATIRYVELLFTEMMRADIPDNFDLVCHQLHQMLPTDVHRKNLWRVRLELGLLARESAIIDRAIITWHRREYQLGVKLLKKTNVTLKPSTAYRSLLTLIYGCAMAVNINPRDISAAAQHQILAKAIADL